MCTHCVIFVFDLDEPCLDTWYYCLRPVKSMAILRYAVWIGLYTIR